MSTLLKSLFVIVLVSPAFGSLEEMQLPRILQRCLDDPHHRADFTRSVGERDYKMCTNEYMMYTDKISWAWLNSTRQTDGLIREKESLDDLPISVPGSVGVSDKGPLESLLKSDFSPEFDFRSGKKLKTSNENKSVNKRILPHIDMENGPKSGFRIRREYRTLSDSEREAYHAAIKRLKESGIYSELAKLHQGPALKELHNGPNFLSWHRVYLILYEEALRQIDSSVSVPYWDYTLDYELEDPTQSIMWTSLFMGNGDGVVSTGPSAGWQAFDAPLIRNIGEKRILMSKENINQILSRNRTADITHPRGKDMFNLEMYHNDIHDWVGGDMSDLNLAPYDPLFYMHHAFIDYIWEQFRIKQYSMGINASRDFPDTNVTIQAPDRAMHGFEQFRNIDGYSDVWTKKWFTYKTQPSCSVQSPSCGSPYLECRLERRRCVSKTKNFVFRKSDVADHQRKDVLMFETTKTSNDRRAEVNNICKSLQKPYQNTFFLNGVSDIDQWVYIPIKLIYVRPNGHRFQSFPIRNGKPQFEEDVYFPSDHSFVTNMDANVSPKSYTGCEIDPSGAGFIYIESYGLNYMGSYTETAIVDHRLPVGSTMAYVGVKRPGWEATEVLLTAHDRCGRMCRPRCMIPDSRPPIYRECSGAVRITGSSPALFGNSISSASSRFWYKLDGDLDDIIVNLAFICDQQEQ
ncbi:hypothetical protein ACJMK2_015410 [Sinanodonta woodiana]|uniref:Tyrosinase copper-binding domain-containing protein n=1 Tax=Sinanodonta woodiana TaxID=1069815 RepID=A0ABD3UTI4_SINWO